ncbi:immunoglobulin-like domain-containing protein [Tenacibaculum sp.]|uniref:immunoglobulin-like domain-containing protein n=1 Tax=Tenacibaculum sp. TaxID=1906242 RepID=UPI003D09CD52
MAKKLLSLITLFFSLVVSAQTTSIPDSAFEQALIDLNIDSDGVVNGVVLTSDISSITTLDVRSKNIQDLTGIEDFTALKQLNVRSNKLTELDISNNVELTILHCGANFISRLNLTNNTKLENLIAENNNLSQIIPTLLPTSLKIFNLSGNELTTLDLSNLPNLQVLWMTNCSNLQYLNLKNGNNTNISIVDIRSNPLLNCVTVDDSSYSDTNWTDKDAHTTFNTLCEEYVYVPDDNFEQALIDLGYDNVLDDYVLKSNISAVTSLEIEEKGISDLTGIGSFTALTFLRIRGNNLSELDLYSNTELMNLYVGYNVLSSLDLSTNTKLVRLALEGNKLEELIMPSSAVNLYEFNASDNSLTEIDLSSYSNLALVIVSDNPLLEKFSIKNGNNSGLRFFQASNTPLLYCIDVDDVSYSETNWTNIDAHTNFSQNCFNDYAYVPDDNFEQALIDLGYDDVLDNYVLTANIDSVTILNLYNKNISNLTGIERFTALKDLDCRVNNLSELDVSSNTELTDLLCGSNNITKLDISANTKLIYFAAEGNGLTELLPSSLPTSIFSLNLNDNSLTSIDLSGMTSLKHIKLRDNPYLGELTLKNIDETKILSFETINTPELYCIQVDDPSYSTTNWTMIDDHTSFSDYCRFDSVYVPDDNFEQALIDLGYDDVLDNYVLKENINTVYQLNLNGKDISDLTGLKGFTSLGRLLVIDNNLTELDVSRNLELGEIYCELNNISKIDVSVNTKLTRLSIGSNPLTELLPSQLTKSLLVLEISYSELKELDVSGLPNLLQLRVLNNDLLEYFNVKNNNNTKITAFQSTSNPLLYCIEVDSPFYSAISWSSIDAHTNFGDDCKAPVITLKGANPQTIELGAGYSELGATTDDGSDVIINSSNFRDAVGTYTIYYDAMDASWNVADQVTRTVNVIDTTAPVITLNGANPQTIELGAGYSELGAMADDGSDVVINTSEFRDAVGTYTIYYDATDASGNTAAQVTRTVNVVDTAPVITLVGANPQTIELGDGYSELGATTNDGSDVVINTSEFRDAIGSYTIYYDATDAYGNKADQVTRTVNVVDTTAPVITLNGTFIQTIELGAGYSELGATTDDGSDVIINSSNFRDAVGAYVIFYDATDAYGNKADQVARIVQVVDTTAPVITLNGANPQTIELGAGYSELGATTDDESNVVINTSEFRDAVGTYTIYYNATDVSWNTAEQVTRTVNVVDTTAPVITLNGANPQTIELGSGYSELGATTNDGSDVVINTSEFRDAVGTYTIYYNATDASWNTAEQVTRTVNVVDTTAPVITLNGANPQTIALGSGYSELGATTDDGSDIIINTSEFRDEIGTYTIYYDATDVSGNTADQVTRTVNVIDTTAPVITLVGANPQTIELGAGYSELGATTDDGSDVVINASEFVDAVGTYTIYYDATDALGNTADQVTRTVYVVDTTAPVITLNGASPQTIELGAGYSELGATTDDGSDVVINTSEFRDVVGTYTIYYNATDASWNTAEQVTRTVNVVDSTAPVITLNGANPQTIELGFGYSELGATTNDGSDVVINTSEFRDAIGSYTIYYDATDASGNKADQVTRTVNVIDTTAPVISLVGANPQTIELGVGYSELGATTDDGSAIVINTSEFKDVVGTYTIYYNATDASGNVAAQVARIVNVVDTTVPTVNCISEAIFALDETGSYVIEASDIDNGSTDLSGIKSLSINRNSFDCSDIGNPVTVTLTVIDNNDLVATCTTTIRVVDTSYPVFEVGTLPSDMVVGVNNTENNGYILEDFRNQIIVTDNCADILSVEQYPSPGQILTAGDHTITIEVFDNYNNYSFHEFVITVDKSLSTGGDDESDEFILYPNPTQGKVYSTIEIDSFEIYNLSGQKIMESSEKEIDLESLTAGVYFARVYTQKGVKVFKIVKE